MDILIYYLPILALIIVLSSLLFSLDDLLIDLYYVVKGRKKLKGRLHVRDLDQAGPKQIAIIVPAWKEDNVIAKMLENTFATLNYPRSFYHIFIGVYPNDLATINVILPLLIKYKNLHLIIGPNDGPSNKADNLNNLYKEIVAYEKVNKTRFSIIVIHDSEDIIHPTSLKLINYLIPLHAAVQLPVFPLQLYPTMRNFFKQITAATYADEFAENHFRGMVVRDATGAFVPSAGTGYAIDRDVLEKLAEKREKSKIFNETSLTEDYEISLQLQLMGYKTCFFIEEIKRVAPQGNLVSEFIATREFFPNTFREAVKQKARWIYGITFQNLKSFSSAKMSLIQKYSLFRDRKAKISNLLSLPGYLVFTYVIVSVFTALPVIFAYGTVAWWLTVLMTLMAVERQLMRAVALRRVYGWRSAIAGCFVPPLLPLRFVWGNVINFFATLRAWRISLIGSPQQRKKWDKTEHHYLLPDVLERYRRKFGDLLLEKELLSPAQLNDLLKEARSKGITIGALILEKNILPERQLLSALGEYLRIGYVDVDESLINPALSTYISEDVARRFKVLPLLCWRDKVLLASAQTLTEEALANIAARTGLKPQITLATSAGISKGLEIMYNTPVFSSAVKKRTGERLIEGGLIDTFELLEAFKLQSKSGEKLGELLVEMNLISRDKMLELADQVPFTLEKRVLGLMNNGLSLPRLQYLLYLIGLHCDALKVAGFAAGECIREILSGKAPDRLDIITDHEDSFFVTKQLHATFGGRIDHDLEQDAFILSPATRLPAIKILAIAKSGMLSGEQNLAQTLAGYYFSVNTMALSLNHSSSSVLYDFFRGYADIEEGLLRIVDDDIYMEKPLALVKTLELKHALGYKVDPLTDSLFQTALEKKALKRLSRVSRRKEVERLLALPNPFPLLEVLYEQGILTQLLDEIELTRNHIDNLQKLTSFLADKSSHERVYAYMEALFNSLPISKQAYAMYRLGYRRRL